MNHPYRVWILAFSLLNLTTACFDGLVGGECVAGFTDVDGVCVRVATGLANCPQSGGTTATEAITEISPSSPGSSTASDAKPLSAPETSSSSAASVEFQEISR